MAEFFGSIVMGVIGIFVFLVKLLIGEPVYPGDPGE